jgi:hypothetical protein
MAAMFQAQTQNWEEAQEKMSQLVLSPCGFFILCRTLSNEHCSIPSIRVFNSAQVIHRNPRGTGFGGRGGKPHMPINDRPLPPSYVCYRCGQKGSHWPNLHKVFVALTRVSFKVTGSKTAPRIMTASLTTVHGSNEQREFLEAC